MSPLPSLSLDDVHDWTEPRFVERGQRYHRSGAVRHPQIEGPRLLAACEGSRPDPYRVEVTLNTNGIQSAWCSCPVGAGGFCKHVVAVLLTWLHEPDRFDRLEDLQTVLERHGKDVLVDLVVRMVKQDRDLRVFVDALPDVPTREAALPTAPDAVAAYVEGLLVDAGVLPRPANDDANDFDADEFGAGDFEGVYSIDYDEGYDEGYSKSDGGGEYDDGFVEWDPDGFENRRVRRVKRGFGLVVALKPLLRHARAQTEHGDPAAACAVLRTLAATLLQPAVEWDVTGDLYGVAQDATAHLGALLGAVDAPDVRREIVDALACLHSLDVDLAHVPAVGDRPAQLVVDAVKNHATPEERETTVRRLSDDLKQRVGEHRVAAMHGVPASMRRLAQSIETLDPGREEDALTLLRLRASGDYATLIRRLLDAERLGEAVELLEACPVRQTSDLVAQIAERDAEAAERAREIVVRRLRESTVWDRSSLQELFHRARDRGEDALALAAAREAFALAPTLQQYETMRNRARELDAWDESLRNACRKRLRSASRDPALEVKVSLLDGDVDEALAQLSEMDAPGLDLRLEVADAAAETHPDEAAYVYLEAACEWIERRTRAHYSKAADALVKLRNVCHAHGRHEMWNQTWDAIRDDTDTLPACRDEFRKAGLLDAAE